MELKVFESTYDKQTHAYRVGEEPLVFHCHHYNLFLQNTIEDGGDFYDAEKLQVQSAEHVVYHQLKALESKGITLGDILQVYSDAGFGKLSFEVMKEEGGLVTSSSEHYGVGYISKYDPRKPEESGVSYFTRGFIAAVFAFMYQKPLYSYEVTQTECFSKGDTRAAFEVQLRNQPDIPLFNFQHGKGVLGETPVFENPQNTSIDYLGIREALINMPLAGAPDNGLIDAFGVLLTRHYANYYCNISYGMLYYLIKELGPEDGYAMARDLLVEAGHVCGFNTFGGIMLSMEWNALIKPMIQTREDWIHGIIACINALGWGTFIIEELIPYKSLKLRMYNDYESNHFLMYSLPELKNLNKPICFLMMGGAAALMNLIYHSDITQNPTLNEEFYNKTFKTAGKFVGKQTLCRSLGSPYALIEVTRENE